MVFHANIFLIFIFWYILKEIFLLSLKASPYWVFSRSWLVGRGWQVGVAELISVIWPKKDISLAEIKHLTITIIESLFIQRI